MKNFKKLLNGTGLIVLLCLMMSLFVSNTVQAQDNNGTIVTKLVLVDGENGWGWIPDNCDRSESGFVPATIARIFYSDKPGYPYGKFYFATGFFQLPEGHCDIPENGAVVTWYSSVEWSKIDSNGKGMFKIVWNPNRFN